jgi:hypothetical protein
VKKMKYLLPMARCLETGETVKTQDLTGARFELGQRKLAEEQARVFADKLSIRTRKPWVGFVETYTPSQRRG